VKIPTIADGGAGFGEPLHTMRTVREFIRAGVAGIHIEDQLYPKRAHYHKYVAHAVPRNEFIDKIKFACRARDETDKDFVVIARTDTCRFEGLEEAMTRLNMAADVGADMGLYFPRNDEEMKAGPKRTRIPLVYVLSRGNRDNRPLPTASQLADMGYKACIDAITYLLVSFHFAKKCLEEIHRTGNYTGMTFQDNVDARQQIENLIGLEKFYEIEEETVEEKKWGKR
jgi:2-methylisocitrate lyase-like PEP mutase family enzyme